MGLQLITKPAMEPVSSDDVKGYLKLDGDDEDAMIDSLIMAARQRIEGYTGRALITQTWEYVLDMPDNKQRVPKPPLQKINSISVIDTDGTVTVVDPKTYIVDTSGIYGRVTPTKASRLAFVDPDLWRGIWPWHRGFASFVINFDCGYGNTPDDVPMALRQAILLYVGHMYENREGESADGMKSRVMQTSIAPDLPPTVRDVCTPYVARVM